MNFANEYGEVFIDPKDGQQAMNDAKKIFEFINATCKEDPKRMHLALSTCVATAVRFRADETRDPEQAKAALLADFVMLTSHHPVLMA